MSALGYACLAIAAMILGLGAAMDHQEPGAFGVMSVLALFPAITAMIDGIDHLMAKTVDKWIAKAHHKRDLEEL